MFGAWTWDEAWGKKQPRAFTCRDSLTACDAGANHCRGNTSAAPVPVPGGSDGVDSPSRIPSLFLLLVSQELLPHERICMWEICMTVTKSRDEKRRYRMKHSRFFSPAKVGDTQEIMSGCPVVDKSS